MRRIDLMQRARWAWLVALALLAACSSSESEDGSGGSGAASGSSGEDGGSGGGSASTGSGGEITPLTDVELGLVGVWRGAGNDDNVNYYVLQEDRTGCTWSRDGEDFGVRYFELQFHDWHLEAGAAESDGRIPISFLTDKGTPQDIERYDPEIDKIHLAGNADFPLTWQDVLILCADTGTNAVETDVERRGTYPEPQGGTPGG